MSEWELPGNGQVGTRIREAAARDTLAHALLFTGSGDREAAARFAAAAMECTASAGRPCGVCPACVKVRRDIHPDVITVRDAEHKNIAVDTVRAARSDAYIRPNEGARKVYLFPDCALLTEQDQNVLLKIVEEGPPYAAFLFCAENPAAVLPTLRSRCVELPLRPQDETRAEAPEGRAEELCRAMTDRRRGAVAELAAGLERGKLSREDLEALLARTGEYLTAALAAIYGAPAPEPMASTVGLLAKNLTKVQIMRTIELLQKYRRECAYNVSVGHVLGALAVELEEGL